MAIPAIEPYPVPGASELPRSCVPWKPAATRCALLIHDMQRYYLEAFTSDAPPLVDLIANIVMLRRRCSALAIPVFYSVQPGAQDNAERGLLRDFWGAGMGTGVETGVVEDLAPGEHDTIVWKRRYSAFHRTALLEGIRKHRRDQILICGVYAHIGCLATALDAFANDVQPFMVADAMAAFSAADHTMALEVAARCCAAITTSRQVVEALRSPLNDTAALKTPSFST